MKTRLLFIGGGALIINTLLFILMESMSAPKAIQLNAPAPKLSIDFVRLKKKPAPTPIKPRNKPKKKLKKPDNLMLPDMPTPNSTSIRVKNINIKIPKMDLSMNISGVPFRGQLANSGLGGLSEAIPLIRTSPLYPPRALSRKIEGKVKVLFTITKEGTVINPKVIQATPEKTFNRAALRAIRKWKFKKKLVDGEAVSWQSVQTISFKLAK